MSRSMVTVATFAAVAAFALPGCFFESRRSTGHVSAGVEVRAEAGYVYFPSHHAYYRESSNDWWVMESGSWAHHTVRPSTIVIRDDTPWLTVNVTGDQPHHRNADHDRDYGKGGRSKGPPPGRGWRK